MRQAQKKKDKDKVAIALMLAFCVIALTSIFTIKSNIDKINGSYTTNNVPVSDQANTSVTEKDKGKNMESAKEEQEKTSTQVSGEIPTVDSATNSSKDKVKEVRFLNPVKSSDSVITNEYAMDSLIYSVTLDQYMTHCGVDIEAPKDTQVVATAPGTVTSVYQDDRYGTSVEITHSDGLVTVYSNLSAGVMVEIGDIVDQGKIIGGIGSTGLFESLEPAHLHLEMLKDGVYVDPMDYIKF